MKTDLTFDEFPESSYRDWRAEAEATLKGAPFEKKLVSRTTEGIELQPIYNASDIADLPQVESLPGFSPFVRGNDAAGSLGHPWEVAQFIAGTSAGGFNTAARNALERGQTALILPLDRAGRLGLDPDQARPGDVGFCGLSISSLHDLSQLLDGTNLHNTAVYLRAGSGSMALFALFIALLNKKGSNLENLHGAVDQDPLGDLVSDGELPVSFDAACDQVAAVTRWALDNAPRFRTLTVHSYPYSDAGSTATQDVAFTLASGVEYLRQMNARGLSVDQVAPRMRFAFSIGSDFFMSIAQLRAARLLWARIIEECGGGEESRKMRIHARTSLWNKSSLDPHVNMLRVTTEAYAAVLGGCESLQTGAFDEVVRPADDFSRRIARNTQLVIRDECHAHRVIDPAGGSWYVEKLTDEFARSSWDLFREIEKAGGMLQAVLAGDPQKGVEAVAAKKREAVEQRRLSLLGVNLYANPTEKPLPFGEWHFREIQSRSARNVEQYRTEGGQEKQTEVMSRLSELLQATPDTVMAAAVSSAAAGATLGEIARTLRAADENAAQAQRLASRRGAEPFEELRSATLAYAATAGHPPRVFLANMGPVRQHKARADFTTGFFEAGGFQVVGNSGFSTPSHAADAAIADSARIIVICSTDDTYPEIVPPLVKAIKSAHPEKMVLLAGLPADHVDAFREAGIDDFIHIRANCYQMLRGLLIRIGVMQ